MKYNEDFVKAYWLFRGRKLHTLRDFGTHLGHNKFYHKSIYSKALEYEQSPEYQKDLLKAQEKYGDSLRGTVGDHAWSKDEETRGRKLKKGYTDKFITVYWNYENFFVTPPAAYAASGYCKNWFHKVAALYEKSDRYIADLHKQEENSISLKPARNMALPSYFSDLVSIIESGKTMEEACKELNVDTMDEVLYKRLKLKYDSKKNIYTAIKLYKNDSLEAKYMKKKQ